MLDDTGKAHGFRSVTTSDAVSLFIHLEIVKILATLRPWRAMIRHHWFYLYKDKQ